MIKLNLLPAWYAGRRLSSQLLILAVVVALGIAAVEFFWLGSIKQQVAATTTQAEKLEAWKAKVDGLNSEASNKLAEIQPITDRLNFFNGVNTYNTQYPALYDKVIRWTYKNVTLSSMSSEGSTVTMQAHARNLNDFARYMLNMYRATDLFSLVTISNVNVAKPGGGGTAVGGMAGMPGRPGMGPMMPGAGGPPMPGAGGPPMPGGMPGRPGMPAMPGAGLAGGGGAPAGGTGSGVDFTVTCTLITPIPPAPPPIVAAAPAAAPGGAAPGMPGGAPGMPGGAPGMPRGAPGGAAVGPPMPGGAAGGPPGLPPRPGMPGAGGAGGGPPMPGAGGAPGPPAP